ncbi:hypothetical protein QBC34DRAFT_459722 [Podospora aff. communis PSN243]|uniref:Uncharacterized protein n=1 Tax=Podospora aff. communis PSN243 TaxID=3040156 RepID=A0AAV9GQZ5_9PEZI|nr:hypothetical protein QBC34DRAFT_459722 [Podospora aff. communis PSN243]
MAKLAPLKSIKQIPDPRPSKANPEHRNLRKEWEKQHSNAFEWIELVGLALTGLAVAFDVERDLRKCEEKRERKEREKGRREGERVGRREGERTGRRESERVGRTEGARSYERGYGGGGFEDRRAKGGWERSGGGRRRGRK